MKTHLSRLLGIFLLAAASVLADDIKVWPLFYQNTDPEAHSRRTEVLWPLYVRQSTADYVANQFLSFPQNYPGQYPGQFYLFWPLSGLRTGAGYDAWLFPLLWAGSEPSGNDLHSALFPAFYYGHKGSSRTLNIALLQHNYWGPNGSGHFLLPFFWRTTDRHGRDAGGTFGALPLVWLNQRRCDDAVFHSASHCGGIGLLSWWHRHTSTNLTGDVASSTRIEASDNVFPIFRRSSLTQSLDMQRDRRAEDLLWLAPYWQFHESRTNGAGTLVKSSHTLLPIYHDWRRGQNATVRSGRIVLPLWFHTAAFVSGQKYESADFLVPIGAHLYRKDDYETVNVLGPLFNRTDYPRAGTTRYDALFPFFSLTLGAHESAGRVFPLAGWDAKDGERDNVWWLFPLGWGREAQGDVDYRRVYPEFGAWHDSSRDEWTSLTDCRNGPRRTVAFYPFFQFARQADEQSDGLLPFYWRNTYHSGRAISRDTILPLVLGDWMTQEKDGVPTYARQNYLFSALAFGGGENSRVSRVFPLYSCRRDGGSRAFSSFVVPFSYDSWLDPERPGQARSSSLTIPFVCLPLFKSQSRQDSGATTNRGSWFFPFYKRSQSLTAEGETDKLSILWPLWNGEWQNDETRIRGLGGFVNYYEKDANAFVEQRLLYRVFTRRTRSWLSEYELMPLYAQSSREDGRSSWGILGGLLGGGSDGKRNYLRLFYLKIPTSVAVPSPAVAKEAGERRHATLALNYLRHGRHDRAAIEFALAGKAFEGDRDMQLAAGDAYLNARADEFGKELRSSVPSSLDPVFGGARGNMATVRTRLRHLAIQHFESALRLGADKPATLRKLAEAQVDLGDLSKALQFLAESDRLQPAFATGMERLQVAENLWRGTFYAGKQKDPQARKEAHEALLALLAELKGRYPKSPTLALREANCVGGDRAEHPFGWAYDYLAPREAFSPEARQCLAVYRQGADWPPGAEEQAWLASKPVGKSPRAGFGAGFGPDEDRAYPQMACARLAVGIMNRQLASLVADKKYDDAAKLQEPLFDLLPRLCVRCVVAGERSRYAYDSDLVATMRHFHALYVDAWKKPEAYLAMVEAFAAKTCRHQQAAVEQTIESMRLEQQYVKTWHVTGTIGGAKVDRQYAGGFFERYVDLDKILGKPDRCTVTAECVIRSPTERQAVLRLGFDHTLTAELNGQTILGPISRKIPVRDEFPVPITLKAGENRLRLTVADDTLAYGFFARLSAPNGTWMRDVTVSH